MDEGTRYRYETELASAMRKAFARSSSYGELQNNVTASAEPILRQVQEEEAAAALLLILLTLDDDDGDVGAQLQSQLTSTVDRSGYAKRRAQVLGRDVADNTRGMLEPGQALEDALTPERAENIGITEVTGAISAGTQAARDIAGGTAGEQGMTIEFVWQTERDDKVCPICRPLDGRPEWEWQDRFPLGPPSHPRCRCEAVPRVVRRRSRESFREAWSEDDHPRGDDGRFISKGEIDAAKHDDAKAQALFDRTTDPEQRARLEKELGKKAPTNKTTKGSGKVNPKVQAWAEKKFKDPEKAKAFATWFGDSKVVDENGEPLVVYHGTSAEFEAFDSAMIGRKGDHAGRGFYTTTNADSAAEFAQGDGGRVIPMHVAISKPFDASRKLTEDEFQQILAHATDEQRDYVKSKRSGTKPLEGLYALRMLKGGQNGTFDATDVLQKSGFDGVSHFAANPQGSMSVGDSGHGRVFVAFSPTQIKSATGNRGTFDPDSPNINESSRGT